MWNKRRDQVIPKRMAPGPRIVRHGWPAFLVLLWPGVPCVVLYGQAPDDRLLIDSDPYDVIVLKENMASYHVMPLPISPRKPIEKISSTAAYEVRMVDRPDKRFRIRGEAIARIRLFEELVLEEAAERVERGRFASAYRAFRYVDGKTPGFPGLDEAWQDALRQEAEYWMERKDWMRAWRVLLALHERNAKYHGLPSNLGQVARELVKQLLARNRVRRGRALVDQLARLQPGHPRLKELRRLLQQYAAKQLAASEAASSRNDLERTLAALRRAAMAAPEDDAIQQRHARQELRSPVFGVALREPLKRSGAAAPWSWSSRQDAWLTAPPLFSAPPRPGAIPGRSVLASWSIESDGVLLRPAEGGKWDRDAVLRRLRTHFVLAPWHAVFRLNAEPFEQDAIRVAAHAASPSRWLGFLRVGIPESGRYNVRLEPERRILEPNQAGMPHLVQVSIPGTSELLDALDALDIALVDRLRPWEIGRLRHAPAVRVEPCGVTTVYWIVFNPRGSIGADRLARWALRRAVDRNRVLEDLCDGDPAEIARPLSSFLPRAWAAQRPPIPYEPETLAAVLGGKRPASEADSPSRPRLILFHPPDTLSERTAQAIEQQWELDGLGPSVVLRSGERFPPEETWDAALVGWTGFDPRWDTWRLLGPNGLAGPPSKRLGDLLQRKPPGNAPDWSSWLAELADEAGADSVLIPLWEIQEFYGRVPELQGTGTRPDPVYQHIDTWKYGTPQEASR